MAESICGTIDRLLNNRTFILYVQYQNPYNKMIYRERELIRVKYILGPDDDNPPPNMDTYKLLKSLSGICVECSFDYKDIDGTYFSTVRIF